MNLSPFSLICWIGVRIGTVPFQPDPKDAGGQGHIALRNMKNVTWRDSLNTKLHAKP
jgi:hypothetical protein